MSEPHTKGSVPFSLRLTPEERRQLEARAGGEPLGVYIRERLFGEQAGRSHKHRRRAQFIMTDHRALSQVLALLGQSRLASNLNQLARAANAGSLPVTPDIESALNAACEDVAAIRSLLMTALGIREP